MDQKNNKKKEKDTKRKKEELKIKKVCQKNRKTEKKGSKMIQRYKRQTRNRIKNGFLEDYAKQTIMSFLADVIPPKCWIILH